MELSAAAGLGDNPSAVVALQKRGREAAIPADHVPQKRQVIHGWHGQSRSWTSSPEKREDDAAGSFHRGTEGGDSVDHRSCSQESLRLMRRPERFHVLSEGMFNSSAGQMHPGVGRDIPAGTPPGEAHAEVGSARLGTHDDTYSRSHGVDHCRGNEMRLQAWPLVRSESAGVGSRRSRWEAYTKRRHDVAITQGETDPRFVTSLPETDISTSRKRSNTGSLRGVKYRLPGRSPSGERPAGLHDREVGAWDTPASSGAGSGKPRRWREPGFAADYPATGRGAAASTGGVSNEDKGTSKEDYASGTASSACDGSFGRTGVKSSRWSKFL